MKILIMGLPGSGKTWLGERITKTFNIPFWDSDVVRKIYNDWGFDQQARERQALRMRKLAEIDSISISAFICPLPGFRSFFFPDKLIWMNTIEKCEYDDTNKLFKPPTKFDVKITKWIEEDQLYNSLKNINLSKMDTENFSNELIQKLSNLS